jgi:1-acyl-sn-glycerol-3-phosphate acyltransferase
MQTLRSFIYIIGMLILIVIAVIMLTLVLPSQKLFNKTMDVWIYLSMRWLKLSCGLGYEVKGRENIPQNPAFLIFAKHQSAWETLSLQEIFDYPISWVLKRGLLWVPIFGWGLKMTRPIAINRKSGRKAVQQLKDQGLERLKSGSKVLIFPEGTRIPVGKIGRFKIGGCALAEHSQYPVVPVAHNAGYFWPKRGFTKKPGTITVKIGKPIDTKGKSADAICAEVQAWMEQAMAEITKDMPDAN